MKLSVNMLLMLGLLLYVAHTTASYDQFEEVESQKQKTCKKPDITEMKLEDLEKNVEPGLSTRIRSLLKNPPINREYHNREGCLPDIKAPYNEYYRNENLRHQDEKRIVCVRGARRWYYTINHYNTFYQIVDISDFCPDRRIAVQEDLYNLIMELWILAATNSK